MTQPAVTQPNLPKYPTRVTARPDLTVNRPTARSPEAYVRALLQLPLTDQRYQIDRFGTKCNFYLWDALTLTGYDYESMVANLWVSLATKGDVPPFVPMVIQDAVHNANLGCPTWAGLEAPSHGHVVMVLPTGPTDRPGDVLVAQAGRSNFYGKRMAFSWPRRDLGRVKFFGAP